MKKSALLFLVTVAVVCASTVELNACGDKFLRIGRGPRHWYAAVHPASILLYVPGAKESDLKEYVKTLKSAGHRPVTVRDISAVSSELALNKYDIVISILPQAPRVKDVAAAAESKPAVVPIVPPKMNAAQADIGRQFEHHLVAQTDKHTLLTELDHVMAVRLNNVP